MGCPSQTYANGTRGMDGRMATAASDPDGLIRADKLTLTQMKDVIDAQIDQNIDYGPPCDPLCEPGPPIS